MLPSGEHVRKNVDMAMFPNFEIAKLWVSGQLIEFSLNLHIINEEPPDGNMVDRIELHAWNAALNCARKHFKKSPVFQLWLNDDAKKIYADGLEHKLASANSFEVRPDNNNPGNKKHLVPLRFTHMIGCLFLEIVWENLIAMARKEALVTGK